MCDPYTEARLCIDLIYNFCKRIVEKKTAMYAVEFLMSPYDVMIGICNWHKHQVRFWVITGSVEIIIILKIKDK